MNTIATPAETAAPTFDRDYLSLMRMIHGMCKVGAIIKYSDFEAKIRMQMSMRKMIDSVYPTPEYISKQVVRNLTNHRYAVDQGATMLITMGIRPLRDFIEAPEHRRGNNHGVKEEDRNHALMEYYEGFR